eukprot:s1270_g25.t1
MCAFRFKLGLDFSMALAHVMHLESIWEYWECPEMGIPQTAIVLHKYCSHCSPPFLGVYLAQVIRHIVAPRILGGCSPQRCKLIPRFYEGRAGLRVGSTLAKECPLPAELQSVLREMKPLSTRAQVAQDALVSAIRREI